MKGLLGVFFFLIFAEYTCAQVQVEFNYKSYNLERYNDNIIQNATYLEDFFEALRSQKENSYRKINIIHIGDSHIQADYLTSVVRKHFQTYFGNAGRGLIVPLQVAGTNGPSNFTTKSNVQWISKKCIHPFEPLPIGIGGVTISTDDQHARLEINVKRDQHDYSFNHIRIFYSKNITSYNFSIKDSLNNEIGKTDDEHSPFPNYSDVEISKPVSTIFLDLVKTKPEQQQATIFGLNATNGRPGILYHAIGVNGARYDHYNAAQYFARQTADLSPDLILISLGTNEAINYPNIDVRFLAAIDKLVTSLQDNNPLAKIILVTPPDSFRKKNKHNPGIEMIRTMIIQYAVENGLAFYDMYKALGGDRSAGKWRAAGLLRNDGIHFTKEGYAHQGDLLFIALMKSYNEFISNRHQ